MGRFVLFVLVILVIGCATTQGTSVRGDDEVRDERTGLLLQLGAKVEGVQEDGSVAVCEPHLLARDPREKAENRAMTILVNSYGTAVSFSGGRSVAMTPFKVKVHGAKFQYATGGEYICVKLAAARIEEDTTPQSPAEKK